MRPTATSPDYIWRERSVFEARQEGSLRFPAGVNQIYARRLLRYQIRRDPHDIASHVRLILSCLDPSLRKPLLVALTDLYIALGNKGQDLRAKLLRMAKPYISKAEYGFFRSAESNGLDDRQPIPYQGSALAAGFERQGQGHSRGDFIEALSTAMKALGKGEYEQAQSGLENAFLKYPYNRDIELALLDVYKKTRDSAAYYAMTRQLKLKQVTPSPDWRDLKALFPLNIGSELDDAGELKDKNWPMRSVGLDVIPVLKKVVSNVPGANDATSKSMLAEASNSRIRRLKLWHVSVEGQSFCSSRVDVDLADPGKRVAVYYSPEIYLQSQLLQTWKAALDSGKPMMTEVFGEKTIFFPDNNSVWTSIKPAALADLCIQKLPSEHIAMRPVTLQEMEIYKIQQNVDDNHSLMADSFVWLVSALTARGRVPKNLDFDKPVSLRYWPNMTRTLPIPGAMRIAALWFGRPTSLSETTRLLKLPQRYVFTFYSAAATLGLLTSVSEDSTALGEESDGGEGLIKRLAQRFRANNVEAA